MASETIRVEGLRSLERGLRETDRDTLKALRKELREAGKVVAMDARGRLSRYNTRSAMGIRPRVRSGLTVYAEQTRRRVTGKRPDWGEKVMSDALVPARDAKRDEVVDMVDRAIGRATESNF